MQPKAADVVLLIIISSIFILMLAGFIIYMVYQYKKRQQRYAGDMLAARLEVQEQTLQHIGRELHDSIGVQLTRAKLMLTTITWQQQAAAQGQVNSCISDISSVIDELRSLARGLNGDYILANGLQAALRQEVDKTRKTGINAGLLLPADLPPLSDEQELILFRIVQEALQNVLKHSGATAVSVVLTVAPGSFKITVADNGTGQANSIKEGSGLVNMKRRAALIGGKFRLLNQPGGGLAAEIVLLLP